jgi:hypothetical protein
MMPVPVALLRFGRYAVNVGVTTLNTTVPIGVFSTTLSFCIQRSEPGAVPGHRFTVCAWPERTVTRIPTTMDKIVRRITLPSFQSNIGSRSQPGSTEFIAQWPGGLNFPRTTQTGELFQRLGFGVGNRLLPNTKAAARLRTSMSRWTKSQSRRALA